jgi:hypothetical protein
MSSIFFCIFLTSSNHSPFKKTLKPSGYFKNNEDVIETAWVNTEAFRSYLEDSDDKVSDDFKISPFFYPSVHFWFLIYTQFSSDDVVVHDKSDLSIIYKIYNFSKVKKNNAANTLIITYDCPASTNDDDIHEENEMLSNPDDDGNYPIYIKNEKIVLIDQVKSDLISATLDRKKTLIKTKTLRSSKKKKGGTRRYY